MSSSSSTEPTVPGAPRAPSPERATAPTPSSAEAPASAALPFVPSVPALELPKGGGAIRGIGEKFSTNLAMGTSSFAVPIFTSPGRGGAGPALGLSYSSGAGNGPFGLGWQVGIPAISRRTDKAIPRYRHHPDEEDTFLLADEEELVHLLAEDTTGAWQPVSAVVGAYQVERFCPRIEGSFTRIERWTHTTTGEVHWRTLSRDNVRSIFGSRAETRIADPDPEHEARVARWLLECTLDDRGNAVVYEYRRENNAGVDPAAVFERNRGGEELQAQRYLKRVRYGNRAMVPWPTGADLPAVSTAPEDWLFEVVFDYGEHTDDGHPEAEASAWPARVDPFSTFRAGFELRTRRLCRRVLMFHRIEDATSPELVRATVFEHTPDPVATRLVSVKQAGYVRNESGAYAAPLFSPAVTLGYVPYAPALDAPLRALDPASLADLPAGIDGSTTRFVDLDLEGIAGMLSEQGRQWYYKRNLGDGHFAKAAALPTMPSVASFADSTQHLASLGGDGGLQLVTESPGLAGYFERTADGGWAAFRPFQTKLTVSPGDPNARLVDLDGDGIADLLIADETTFQWFHAKGRAGWESGGVRRKDNDEEKGPRVVFQDGTESIVLADMTGDGLMDLVRIRNGSICYWPNRGYGHFEAKVTMAQSPRFDHPEQYRPDRVRLADVDGAGTTDVLYLGRHGVQLWVNQSGNRFAAPVAFRGLGTTSDQHRVDVLDLLGQGTGCLVVSSSLPGERGQSLCYLDLLPQGKPYLLNHMDNGLGAITDLEYATSTRYYLQDRRDGKPWATKLPFPVQVVARSITTDLVSGTQVVQRHAYHHGYYDRAEREFRGFARVESWDSETVPRVGTSTDEHLPPVRTQTWFHTGAFLDRERLDAVLAEEFYAEPAAVPTGMVRQSPVVLPPVLPTGVTPEELREATRALKGATLRQEVYAEDGMDEAAHPYAVTTSRSRVLLVQGAHGQRHAVVRVEPVEAVSQHYERAPFDPRVSHELTLAVDAYGSVTRSARVAYGRRVPLDASQQCGAIVVKEQDYLHKDGVADWYRLGLSLEQRSYEVVLAAAAAGRTALYTVEELAGALTTTTDVPYEQLYVGTVPAGSRRLLGRTRMWYAADASPHGALAFGAVESLALPHHQHTLVATDGLLAHALGDAWPTNADATAQDAARAALMGEGGYVRDDGAWWVPSGTVTFDAARFYVPTAFASPFPAGHPRHGTTSVTWDAHALHPVAETDAVGNTTTVSYDPRTLAVQSTTDANLNRSRVAFDALGRVTATWVQGKAGAGDGDTDALPGTRVTYRATFTQAVPATLTTPAAPLEPAYAHVQVRRDHNLPDVDGAFEESRVYADGFGREAQTKVRCEPAPGTTAARWIGTGRTVYNNKGLPLRKYEQYFAATPGFETEDAVVTAGVSPEMTYDPMGRVMRTDLPDGTFTKGLFSPWRTESWDANDTVADSEWYAARAPGSTASAEEKRAAQLSRAHRDTPTVVHLDALGRAHRTITDNGTRGQYTSTVTQDVEGHTLVVTDARNNDVQADIFDQGGRVLRRTGMDTGVDRALPELAGQPMREWTARDFARTHAYDAIGRPTTVSVTYESETRVSEHHVYGEAHDDAEAKNLRGRSWQLYDGAGRATSEQYDFRGNPVATTRRVLTAYDETPDWTAVTEATTNALRETAASGLLSDEVFTSMATFDARNRATKAQPPRATSATTEASLFSTRAREVRSTYNLAGLLETVSVVLGNDTATPTPIVTAIAYDEKRRRKSITHGNGATTAHTYDPTTFRLTQLVTAREGVTRQDLSYTYDAAGNIVRVCLSC